MRASCIAIVAAALTSCVTDAPAIPAHLDPASDQIAESPQPFERSLAGEVPPEARPLEERKAQPAAPGHHHGAEPAPSGQQYTCPMHPEVRQSTPGECPKCGMRLVEQTVPDAGGSTPRPAAPKAAPAPAAEVYTCPMHPEIRQPQPGRCPKCGMKLEPAAEPHGEHR